MGGVGAGVGALMSLLFVQQRNRRIKQYFGELEDDDRQWLERQTTVGDVPAGVIKRARCCCGSKERTSNVTKTFKSAVYGGSVRFEDSLWYIPTVCVPQSHLDFAPDGTVSGQEDGTGNPITGVYNRHTLKLMLDFPGWMAQEGFQTHQVKCRLMWDQDKERFIGIAFRRNITNGKVHQGVMKLRLTHSYATHQLPRYPSL